VLLVNNLTNYPPNRDLSPGSSDFGRCRKLDFSTGKSYVICIVFLQGTGRSATRNSFMLCEFAVSPHSAPRNARYAAISILDAAVRLSY
jgi:hypothetical protein